MGNNKLSKYEKLPVYVNGRMKMEFDKEKFAKDLVLKRMVEKRMTLREVGERIGVSFSMISRYERQECEPRIGHLIRACEWLKTNIQDYIKSV